MAEQDELAVHAESGPDISALQSEFERCFSDTTLAERMEQGDDVRYARWEGQATDGLVHQELLGKNVKAKPWDKSSDVREFLADDTINSLTDILVAAFWASRFRAEAGYAKTLTALQAGEVRNIARRVMRLQRRELVRTVERAAQAQGTYGTGVLAVTWRRKKGLRMLRLNMAQIMEQAGQPGSDLADAPRLIADPLMEEGAVSLLQRYFPHVKTGQGRKIVRELRETGETEFPVSYVRVDQPEIRFLLPFRQVLWPPETTDLQTARVIFERQWLSQAEVEARGAEEEWDPAFVEAVKTTAGQRAAVATVQAGLTPVTIGAPDQLIELVWAHTRQVDKNGIEGIWVTLYSPVLGMGGGSGQAGVDSQPYGYHELLNYAHGEQPFIEVASEYAGERVGEARGVPDVAGTAQWEIKRMRDNLQNYARLALGPPLLGKVVRGDTPPALAPFGVIHENAPGQWRWMDNMPGKPELVFQLQESLRQRNSDYFGLLSVEGHQGKNQVRQQRLVTNWLMSWEAVFYQAVTLAYQFWPAEKLAEILGHPPTVTAEMLAQEHIGLWFDVRSLDSEWVIELTKALNQFVLPLDVAGTIDRAKLISFVMSYLEPTLAEEVVVEQSSASQALYRGVREEILQMASGNEAMYTEMDPAAQSKLQYAQEILGQNPKYQSALQQDARFKELLEKYAKNLQQSVVQQENKQVGRIGVKPQG